MYNLMFTTVLNNKNTYLCLLILCSHTLSKVFQVYIEKLKPQTSCFLIKKKKEHKNKLCFAPMKFKKWFAL